MRVQARPSRLRCVWCLGALEGAARKCPGCGVLVHALCAVEAGVCPSLGCGYSVWHAPARRVRSSAAVRAERALVAWSLVAIAVWMTNAIAGLRVAARNGIEVRLYALEQLRDR